MQHKLAASGITLVTGTGCYLISAAGNIPHYIQLLASEVWQYLVGNKKTVTMPIVDYLTASPKAKNNCCRSLR